jgi:hypothetical protein
MLFEEYAAETQLDLCFQNFSTELETLSSMYAPPHGALLLAEVDETTAGCVAVRRFRDDVCEMKRLYLRLRIAGGIWDTRSQSRSLEWLAILAIAPWCWTRSLQWNRLTHSIAQWDFN